MHARLRQRFHLIFHQRNERGDDKRDARQQKCRHLIAHGFARARRHDAQRIAACEQCVYNFLLTAAKGRIAEIAPQNIEFRFHRSVPLRSKIPARAKARRAFNVLN